MAESSEPFILVVEDDAEHSALIQAAFKKSLARAKLHFVFSGWEGSGLPCQTVAVPRLGPVSTSVARRPRPRAAGHEGD